MGIPPRRGVRKRNQDAAPHGTTGFTRMPAAIPPLAWMPLSQGVITLSALQGVQLPVGRERQPGALRGPKRDCE